MKKIIFIIIIGIFIFAFQSCELAELVYDIDKTDSISAVSVKPKLVLLGEPIISLKVGESYSDAGILASEIKDGDNDLKDKTSIIDGLVDPSSVGFYVVTYKSENTYGWASYAYRSVLVYEGDAWGLDIASNYRIGFKYHAAISKYEINGYWKMDNVWAEDGVEFPIVFAEAADGTYKIVPGEHETKGRYSGTGEISGNKITFTLSVLSSDGISTTKNFTWQKG